MKPKLRRRAIEEILRSEKLGQELYRRGELVLTAIDHEGYVVEIGQGKSRIRVAVIAASPYARRSNAKHNTLISNLDAARGN